MGTCETVEELQSSIPADRYELGVLEQGSCNEMQRKTVEITANTDQSEKIAEE
jgi:hypothetical protein